MVQFEAINFQGKSEYLRFVQWMKERVLEGSVEQLNLKTTNPLEKKFFRLKGSDEIWTLVDPPDPDYIENWGFFGPVDKSTIISSSIS